MKIVILDAATLGKDVDLGKIKRLGETIIYDVTPHEERIKRIKDAQIVVTNKVIIDRKVMDTCSSLKLVCVAATGYNNVDVEYARQKKIAVTNVAGYSTESVAQHTFAMLFYLLHQLRYYDEYVKSSQYSKSPLFTHFARPFWELNGKTWGIIGLGRIGRRVAQLAETFGCKVIYYSTSGVEREENYPKVSLEELMRISDIVSIHAPLNERTKGLINYKVLSLMKPTAILLNLGRGSIVVEEDLARALNEGKLFAAGLDVLEHEPINHNNPLLKVKEPHRILITPHNAWTSKEARQKLVDEIAANIEAFLKGESKNRVV